VNQQTFSITIQSDDFAFIKRLRGLALFCQSEMNDETEACSMEEDWKRDNHKASFHFTSKESRKNFIHVANGFSHPCLWKIIDLKPAD
jgi:hypothetical protein